MPRKGQRLKTHKRAAFKPAGPARGERIDPLGHLPLTRYMDAHFEWMLVTGYTAETVRARRIAIRRFIAWCDERGLHDPREITKPILDRYQRHLYYYRKADGAPLTIATQFGCLSPLKTFFKWLTRENHILYNPASEMDLPKTPKQLPRTILSVQDIEAILREAEPNNAQGLRDRAMLELLYSTGLRRMEMANLKRYDADLNRGIVFVREGKGGKDRFVPLGERAALWLDKYLTEARPELTTHEHDALFVTDYGEPVSGEFLAIKVKRYMEFAGIHKPGSCHLFRHACATHMLENGADIRFIQAMLGHASLTTTERYTHVAIDKLQQIHAATHPARMTRAAPDAPAMPEAAGQAWLDELAEEANDD